MSGYVEEEADYQEDENDQYVEEERGDEGNDDFDHGDGSKNEHEDIGSDEMQKRVQEMEEELEKLTKMQQQVDKQINSASDRLDENSIYVGQVDYEATAEELRAHFASCGTINRVTIICDKITGQAKGFGYIEFADRESLENALKLDDSSFKGRQLKVLPKRQNVPFARGGRGRGGRYQGPGSPGGRAPGRGRGRGGFYPPAGGFNPYYGGGRGGRVPRGGGGRFRGGRGRGPPAYHNAYY